MDTSQYLEMFIEESKEHLQACNMHLLELEKHPEDLTIVNEVFRAAHTLKGMSATMGYDDIADLTHVMENILDAIRNEKLQVTTEILDVVFEAVVHLEEMVLDIEAGGTGKKDVQELVELLNRIEAGETGISSAESETAAVMSSVEGISSTNRPFHYDEFEMTVILQSFEQGYGVYEMTVKLREDCLLKAARVFMVFEILEAAGDIIKSVPQVGVLEDEDFDQQFTVVLISKEASDVLKGKVMKVSEIEEVIITPLSEQILTDSRQSQEKPLVKPTVESTSEEKKEIGQKTSTPSPRTAQAHTANRTIRVNIDRLDILMNF